MLRRGTLPDKDWMRILTENIQNKLKAQLCEPEGVALQLLELHRLESLPDVEIFI